MAPKPIFVKLQNFPSPVSKPKNLKFRCHISLWIKWFVNSCLRLLGASQSTIEQELKRLLELESLVFNDFRRDMIKKLRRQSVKVHFLCII